MKNTTEIDWDRLNAYVDGELSLAEAARLAAAVADDPALAREMATLSLLKAASAEAMDPDADQFPTLTLPRARPDSPLRVPALAASLALVMAGAIIAAALFFTGSKQNDELAVWLDRAEEHYHAWLSADPQGAIAQPDGELQLKVSGAMGQVPDLSIARLRIAHVVAATAHAPDGLFVGYVGTRGCRLGLWMAPAPAGLNHDLVIAPVGETFGATWRVANAGFRIVARDMDAARFRAVAEYLVHMTRRTQERESMRMAANPDVMAAPCLS